MGRITDLCDDLLRARYSRVLQRHDQVVFQRGRICNRRVNLHELRVFHNIAIQEQALR